MFFVLLLLAPRRRGPPATTPGIATPGEKGHGLLAGAVFAATVLIKLVPLVYAPAIIAMSRKARAQVIAGAGTGIVVLAAPFLPDLRNGLVTLGIYLERWEFAGFAYRSLRAATGSGETARILLAATFILTCGVIYGRSGRNGFVPGDDGPAPTGSLIRAMYLATLSLLLLTPTLHPWYALYLAALLPLAAEPAGLVLSWSVFLGYRVLTPYAILGRWIEDSLVPALIAVPPLVVLAATAWLRRRLPPAR
jgi:hypothetical protein